MNREYELKQQVRESGTLAERLESCRDRIGKMCSEGRPPRMSIPIQWNDDDFFISVTLQDAISALNCPQEQKTFKEVTKPLMEWLRQNKHPHMSIIVDATRAELVEGVECAVADVSD